MPCHDSTVYPVGADVSHARKGHETCLQPGRKIHSCCPACTLPYHMALPCAQELNDKKEEIELDIVDEQELCAAQGVSAFLDYMCA